VHHFLFFLKAIEDILFGIGLVFACRFLARNLRSKLFRKSAAWDTGSTHLRDRTEVVLIATGIAVFLVLAFPAYRTRFDFTAARAEALEIQQQKPRIDAYHWILSNTKPDDVFLSMVGDADLRIVAPAGRKVVATCVPEFSNPYVAWQPRHDLAAFMRKKLESHSADALATLEHNHVDYIMSSSAAADWLEYYSPFLSAEFAE